MSRIRSRLQRRMPNVLPGRRGGRVARRVMDRPEYDGDSDGFITNPLTGRDEIPWNKAKETPEQAVSRFFNGRIPPAVRRSLRDMGVPIGEIGKPSKRTTAIPKKAPRQTPERAAEMSRRLTQITQARATVPSMGSSGEALSPADQVNNFIAAALLTADRNGNSGIKDRPWKPIAARLKEIQDTVDAKFGKLATDDDFKQAFDKVGIVFENNTGKPITTSSRSFLTAVLHQADKYPDHFKSSPDNPFKNQIILDDTPGAVQASQQAWSFTDPDDVTSVETAMDQMSINVGTQNETFGEDLLLRDTVSAQAILAYLNDLRNGNIMQPAPGEDLAETLNQIRSISGAADGLHEAAHWMHSARARRDFYQENDLEGIRQLFGQIADQDQGLLTDFFAARAGYYAVRQLVAALSLEADFQRERAEEPEGRYAGFPEAETLLEWMMASFEAMDPTEQALSAPTMQSMIDLHTAIAPFQEYAYEDDDIRRIVAKVLGGKSLDEFVMSTPTAFARMYVKAAAKANGISEAEIRSAIWNNNKIDLVAMYGMSGNTWDKLSEQQISILRAAWKYISSYAKDKNSLYDFSDINFASLEGIAEATSLRELGLDFPPKAIAASAAFDAFLAWMRSWPQGES